MTEDYLINITFSNKGEEGAIPVNADNLNLLINKINASLTKIQHINADSSATTFDGTPVYHGETNEFVVTDEKGNLSTSIVEESEE